MYKCVLVFIGPTWSSSVLKNSENVSLLNSVNIVLKVSQSDHKASNRCPIILMEMRIRSGNENGQ